MTATLGNAWPDRQRLKSLNYLNQQGFKYFKSVKCGISAWSERNDLLVPQG